MAQNSRHKRKEVICLCNEVSRETVEAAIREGAKTLDEVFDRTFAGVGPCGGSCRPHIKILLKSYLATGQFPPPPLKKPR